MPGPKGHRVGYLLVYIVSYIRLLNRSTKVIKDQESIQSRTIPVPGHQMGK